MGERASHFTLLAIPVLELAENASHDRLDRLEDIFLRDEAHLDIELVEFAGATVSARILIAETWRDLEIAVKAGHHEQLFELLRRLRQRVELPRVQTRRHEEV